MNKLQRLFAVATIAAVSAGSMAATEVGEPFSLGYFSDGTYTWSEVSEGMWSKVDAGGNLFTGLTDAQAQTAAEGASYTWDEVDGAVESGLFADTTDNAADIALLETSVSDLETAVASNDTDIATNVADIATNASNVASNLTAIALNTQAIADELLARAAADSTLTAAAASAQSAADAAQSAATAAQTAADNAQVSANLAIAANGVNASAITANAALIATNAADLVIVASDIVTNATAIAANLVKIVANTSGVAGNVTAIAANATAIAANATAITALQGLVSALQTAVSANTSAVALNATAITANATNVASNATAIAANASAIASLITSVATNATAITDAAAFDLAARGVIQSDVDANETASDLADSSATTDRALIRTELATAKGALETLITAEATTRANGDVSLANSIASEVSTLEATIATLQLELDNLSSTGSSSTATVAGDLAQEILDRVAAVGAEETRALAAELILTNAIASEETRALAAELILSNNLASEILRAVAAELVLTNDLASESLRAVAAELVLRTDLASEVSDRIAAIAQEVSDRNAAIAAALVIAANTQSGVDATQTGDIAQNAADLVTEATTRANADIALQSNIDSEATRTGTFTSVAATPGTPEVSEVLGTITGTYTPSGGTGVTFTIVETSEGVWQENGGLPIEQSIIDGYLNIAGGVTTLGNGSTITNVTGSMGETFVAAVAGTEGTFAGDGLFGDVAVAITAEQTARIAEDAALQANIDANEAASAAAIAAAVTSLSAAIASGDAATAADAATALANAVSAQATINADHVTATELVQSNLDSEASTRAAADITLQANIDTEQLRAETAEAAIAADLVTEATVRAAADSQIAADLVAEAVIRANADFAHDMKLAAHEGRLNDIDVILADHEARISFLESLHVVDKSFSKVIDGPNGTKIVMHFDADGTQRGKARTLTFLENPVVHGEFDILWNDAGEAVNAITGKLVDPMTGLEFDEMAGFSAAAVEDVNVFFGDMFITPKTNTTPFDTAFVAEEVAPVAPFSLDAGTFVLPSSASKVGSK